MEYVYNKWSIPIKKGTIKSVTFRAEKLPLQTVKVEVDQRFDHDASLIIKTTQCSILIRFLLLNKPVKNIVLCIPVQMLEHLT